MRLPRLSIVNYQFTIVVFLLVVLWGVSSYMNMSRTEDPVLWVPGGGVTVVYPGANPLDMEQLIVDPLEEAINELDDILEIRAVLGDGFANVSVEFMYGNDPQRKYDEFEDKVNSVRSEFPDGVLSVKLRQFTSTDVATMQLALVSETASYQELEDEAEDLKKIIERVDGVKRVKLLAFPEQEVRIAMDIEKMAQMNLDVTHVAQAVQSSNANIPGGAIQLGDKSFGVKTSGSYQDLEEIRNTVVGSYMGKIIYLKHIADVDFAYEDANYCARFKSNMGGYHGAKRALFITMEMKSGFNIFNVTDWVKDDIADYVKTLDPAVRLEYIYDQSQGVSSRINGFMSNLLQGVVLVGIVIFLALGFRSSIIVIIAIPLSIIIGLAFLSSAGYGLQQISIAALVIALGLLVDNSIVMVENINRFLAMGYDSKEASALGASQIAWPIVSATVTTLLAFVPLLMMPDKVGDFIRSMPITVIATLAVSLVVALTLTPLLCSKFYAKRAHKSASSSSQQPRLRGFEKGLRRFIEKRYRPALAFVLHRPWLAIGLVLVVMVGSFAMFPLVGVSFFPKAETPQLVVWAECPEGASLDKTDEVARYVESVLDTIPEVKHYAVNIGHGNPRIYYNFFSKYYDKAFADFYVELKDYEYEAFNSLVDRLRGIFSQYKAANVIVKTFEQGPPIDAPVEIFIKGDKLDTLRRIANDVESYMRRSAGAININNELSKQRTDLFFNIDRDKAAMYGVPLHQIDYTIRSAISGATVSTFRDKEGKEYSMVMRLPAGEKGVHLDDFDKIYVKSLTGKMIPIQQLAKLEFKKAPSAITRYDQQRTAVIRADVTVGYTVDGILAPILEKLEQYPFPKGYYYEVAGAVKARSDSFGGMQQAVMIALIAIFAVLVLQFRSFVQPIIIFVAIPLALIGSIWALFITGYSFSFTAFVGIISLVGIVINNSIILVDYTNQLRKDHANLTILSALQTAGETRFTPIVLTTLTTVGGLLPLTLQGGTMWAPMGWTIIGGLLVSTVLTLVVVPVFYKLMVRESR